MNNKLIVEPQRLVMPTVKVRRLGYFCGLAEILGRESVPHSILISRFVQWAKNNQGNLEKYCKDLPVERITRVKTTGGINSPGAARRYINVARELGFVVRLFRQWQNSKTGNVLRVLPKEENPFNLSLAQIYFLLKTILKADYDYLRIIYDLGRLSSEQRDHNKEWKVFQRGVKQQFVNKINVTSNPRDVVALQDSLRNLESWSKNPERFYRENIKATRLEWFLDLKLLTNWNQEQESYYFRPNASLFFEESTLSDHWLNNVYPCRFYQCFKSLFKREAKKWEKLSASLRRQLLNKFLFKGLNLFSSSSALPKISAGQFFEYSIATLLSEHCIIVNYESFEKDLVKYVTIEKSPYRFVKMISADDIGYIVRENSSLGPYGK